MHTAPVIRLRALRSEDAETFADWAADERFNAHAGWTAALPRAASLSFWHRLATAPPPELLRLVAVLDGEHTLEAHVGEEVDGTGHVGKIVGAVDLHGLEETERELGYVVGPSTRWGRGLGTALARAGLEHAFTRLHLDAVWAEALPANCASVRILERIGMRPTGLGDHEEFLGVPGRYAQYRITREEHRLLSAPAAHPMTAGDLPGTARNR